VKALEGPRELLAGVETRGEARAVLLAGLGRRRRPARLRAAIRSFTAVDAGFGARLVLAWASLRIRADDVHTITLDVPGGDSDDLAEVVQRCLDTRSRAERTPAVRPPPTGRVPVDLPVRAGV